MGAGHLNTLLWKITVLEIGATTLLFVVAMAVASVAGAPRRIIVGLAVLQAGIYGAWMLFHDEFIYVIADYVPAVLLTGILYRGGRVLRDRMSGP